MGVSSSSSRAVYHGRTPSVPSWPGSSFATTGLCCGRVHQLRAPACHAQTRRSAPDREPRQADYIGTLFEANNSMQRILTPAFDRSVAHAQKRGHLETTRDDGWPGVLEPARDDG